MEILEQWGAEMVEMENKMVAIPQCQNLMITPHIILEAVVAVLMHNLEALRRVVLPMVQMVLVGH